MCALQGMTALLYACYNPGRENIVEYLLSIGADVNVVSKVRFPEPFHDSCRLLICAWTQYYLE
jgi:ankyrin repeat protein